MQQRASSSPGRPLGRLGETLGRMPPPAVAATGVVLTLAAGLFDYLTGPQFGALTFYLLPVALVGRVGKRWQGIACGVLAATLWAIAEAVDGRPYDSSWVFLWNSLTRLVVFLVIASLLHRRTSLPDADPGAVTGTGAPCPHCGSTETVALRMGLVCQSCKRLS